MGEVWIVTWFCLSLHDPACAGIEGKTGNITFTSSEMCEIFGRYSANVFRRQHHIPLAYVCAEIVDVWKPTPRPKGLRDKGIDRGLPWPEIKFTPVAPPLQR